MDTIHMRSGQTEPARSRGLCGRTDGWPTDITMTHLPHEVTCSECRTVIDDANRR